MVKPQCNEPLHNEVLGITDFIIVNKFASPLALCYIIEVPL